MRPVQAGWVRDIRDKCVAQGIPFMFKHWGHKDYNPDPTDPSLHGDPKGGCRLDGVFWEQVPK
jgi:protein gp37